MGYLSIVLCLSTVLFIYIGVGAISHGPEWGDINGEVRLSEKVQKMKIPLFRRSSTIRYPKVGEFLFIIKAIKNLKVKFLILEQNRAKCEAFAWNRTH